MAQTWLNSDGLYIKFGNARGTAGIAGSFQAPDAGALTVVEFDLDLTTLGTASAIIEDNVVIPKNSRIEKIQTIVKTAATGSGAVLNVGLVRTDRTTTYDADGLLEAVILTSLDAANETNTWTVNGAGAGGALVGTTLANNGLVVADYDTAAFTAGVVKIKIYYTVAANRS